MPVLTGLYQGPIGDGTPVFSAKTEQLPLERHRCAESLLSPWPSSPLTFIICRLSATVARSRFKSWKDPPLLSHQPPSRLLQPSAHRSVCLPAGSTQCWPAHKVTTSPAPWNPASFMASSPEGAYCPLPTPVFLASPPYSWEQESTWWPCSPGLPSGAGAAEKEEASMGSSGPVS